MNSHSLLRMVAGSGFPIATGGVIGVLVDTWTAALWALLTVAVITYVCDVWAPGHLERCGRAS